MCVHACMCVRYLCVWVLICRNTLRKRYMLQALIKGGRGEGEERETPCCDPNPNSRLVNPKEEVQIQCNCLVACVFMYLCAHVCVCLCLCVSVCLRVCVCHLNVLSSPETLQWRSLALSTSLSLSLRTRPISYQLFPNTSLAQSLIQIPQPPDNLDCIFRVTVLDGQHDIPKKGCLAPD